MLSFREVPHSHGYGLSMEKLLSRKLRLTGSLSAQPPSLALQLLLVESESNKWAVDWALVSPGSL